MLPEKGTLTANSGANRLWKEQRFGIKRGGPAGRRDVHTAGGRGANYGGNYAPILNASTQTIK